MDLFDTDSDVDDELTQLAPCSAAAKPTTLMASAAGAAGAHAGAGAAVPVVGTGGRVYASASQEVLSQERREWDHDVEDDQRKRNTILAMATGVEAWLDARLGRAATSTRGWTLGRKVTAYITAENPDDALERDLRRVINWRNQAAHAPSAHVGATRHDPFREQPTSVISELSRRLRRHAARGGKRPRSPSPQPRALFPHGAPAEQHSVVDVGRSGGSSSSSSSGDGGGGGSDGGGSCGNDNAFDDVDFDQFLGQPGVLESCDRLVMSASPQKAKRAYGSSDGFAAVVPGSVSESSASSSSSSSSSSSVSSLSSSSSFPADDDFFEDPSVLAECDALATSASAKKVTTKEKGKTDTADGAGAGAAPVPHPSVSISLSFD